MSTYRTQGIILRRGDFGEANLLVYIWTKDFGKIEAVGKSARKAKGKLKGHLEPFLYADFNLVRGKKMDTVAGSFIIDPFLSVRGSFDKILAASVVAEIGDRMTVEGYKDERVFDLILLSLSFLDRAPEREKKLLWLLILFFEVNLLSLSGFAPQSDKCVFCGERMLPGKNYFSFSLGGALDALCAAKIPDAVRLSDDAIKLLRFLAVDPGASGYKEAVSAKLFELLKLRVDSGAIFRAVFLMKDFIEFNIDRRINSFDTFFNFAGEKI
jgi:DNA repair protein RecO (recombination protein O)